MGCSIAPADDCEDGYGDGPIRIGSGGLVVMVEVAHNDNLTNFKKFVIIYIQAKELSDIVPTIKALTADSFCSEISSLGRAIV